MRNQSIASDLTVVGGGLAGVCAAIAAARLGSSVALINNRPVLGGNSSSEVRVWVCGATGHGSNHFAREGGIMGELFVENQFRNPDGNPYYWDLVVLEAVRAEPNITLFLNTDVREVVATGPDNDRRIESVTGWTMGSEISTVFTSPLFIDCSGDGLLGFLAGAEHRIGREASAEYGESFAPEVADDLTLGSTLLFYTKDQGHPTKYVAPSFAKDITKTSIPERRIIKAGDNGCAYWWIEWGGEHDIVDDNEMIRDELWSAIYGIWDHIKNSGKFDAETMTLEWVGAMPGKREYRRFLGEHVLTQNDILDQVEFADRVAIGGWSIDLHPPTGMYAPEAGSKHRYAKGIYHVPYRSLYSRNVSNMLMAGRDISATHVAFGSTRVMATCAVIGEAAGTAAALCKQFTVSPAGLSRDHTSELVATLLRQDATIVGLPLVDPDELVGRATLAASSSRTDLTVDAPDDTIPLDADIAIVVPADPRIDLVRVMVDTSSDVDLVATMYDTVVGQNYVPERLVATDTTRVPAGPKQWVEFRLPFAPDQPHNAFVVLTAAPGVELYVTGEPTPGVLALVHREVPDDAQEPSRSWDPKPLHRRSVCLQVEPPTAAFEPAKAADGYIRPWHGAHMWVSEPLRQGRPETLTATWTHPVDIRRVDVILDDDVNEDLINLHHHKTPFDTIPTLAKDFRIEVRVAGTWIEVASIRENRTRRHRLMLPAAVHTDALRVVIESTNGAPAAHVIAMRAYT